MKFSTCCDGGKGDSHARKGQTRQAQVRRKGSGKSRTRNARDETGEAALGQIGQEGDEPKTGDRHRPFRSSRSRRQSPAAETEFLAKGVVQEEVLASRSVDCLRCLVDRRIRRYDAGDAADVEQSARRGARWSDERHFSPA